MEELHEIISAYEMRNKHENPSKREVDFEATKKHKNKESKLSERSYDGSVIEESNFVRNPKISYSKFILNIVNNRYILYIFLMIMKS